MRALLPLLFLSSSVDFDASAALALAQAQAAVLRQQPATPVRPSTDDQESAYRLAQQRAYRENKLLFVYVGCDMPEVMPATVIAVRVDRLHNVDGPAILISRRNNTLQAMEWLATAQPNDTIDVTGLTYRIRPRVVDVPQSLNCPT